MDRATKKALIIVAILFVYMAGMTLWGYRKGTVNEEQALYGMGGMCLILVALFFAYRQRQRFRDKRRNKEE